MVEDVNEYVIRRKYKGKIIEVKVRDYFIDGRRSTTITCEYNPIMIGFSDATEDKINCFIERDFNIAKKEIDNNSFVKKIVKLFR